MNEETDDLIRDALRREEERIEATLDDDLQITELIVRSFRGRQRWLTIFPMLLSLVYSAILFWSAYEFFQTENVKHQIAWATLFTGMGMSIIATKIWIWGEWRRAALTRELKRLELRVVELSERLGS